MSEDKVTVSFSVSKTVVGWAVAILAGVALVYLLIFARPLGMDDRTYNVGMAILEATDAYYDGRLSIGEMHDVVDRESDKLPSDCDLGIEISILAIKTYAMNVDFGMMVAESEEKLKESRDDLWDDLHGIF